MMRWNWCELSTVEFEGPYSTACQAQRFVVDPLSASLSLTSFTIVIGALYQAMSIASQAKKHQTHVDTVLAYRQQHLQQMKHVRSSQWLLDVPKVHDIDQWEIQNKETARFLHFLTMLVLLFINVYQCLSLSLLSCNVYCFFPLHMNCLLLRFASRRCQRRGLCEANSTCCLCFESELKKISRKPKR